VKCEEMLLEAPPALTRTRTRTVTDSPAVNGCRGRKLAPTPAEYAATRPECDPLVEPTTETSCRSLAGTPRKLICVAGEASEVPTRGEIVGCGTFAAVSAVLTGRARP
jgi:hypothetical protein